jgi:hypothetical protein
MRADPHFLGQAKVGLAGTPSQRGGACDLPEHPDLARSRRVLRAPGPRQRVDLHGARLQPRGPSWPAARRGGRSAHPCAGPPRGLLVVPDVDAGAACVVWSGCDVRQAGAGLAKGLMSGLANGWTPARAGPFLRRSRGGPARLGRAGGLSGSGSQQTRWDGDARQPVVQGRSLSGLRTAQMRVIRSSATSNANTVTMTPSC